MSIGENAVVPDDDESVEGFVTASDGLPARKSGDWIVTKHHYLDHYCGIFSTGMKNLWPRRVFIDVMAGPGLCKIRDTGHEMDGSPLIALNHPFTSFAFVENLPSACDALKKRVTNHPKGQLVKVACLDWKEALERGDLDFPDSLVLAFIDPTGISQIPWKSIKRLIEGNRAIDLLFTIQYAMGITLNAGKYSLAVSQETALDRFLDEKDWRTKFDARIPSTFREQVLNRFSEKMAELGFASGLQKNVGTGNRTLYRMALYSKHPKAQEFWKKILKIDEQGQRSLF
jgi:three-Cys-motif partner protein